MQKTVSELITPTFDFQKLIQPVPTWARFIDPDYYIWGASMIRDKEGVCHLYYSRWPKRHGHFAWVTHSEIAHAISGDPLGPYQHVDVSLPVRGIEWWDGVCTHNPTIHFYDGHYYLYYMGLSADAEFKNEISMQDPAWWVYRNRQRIGVAISSSPSGPWKRLDYPIIDVSEDENKPDSLLISNPSVTHRPDGTFLLIYKAVGKERCAPFGGPVVHLAATSDRPDGPFQKDLNPIFTSEGNDFPAEDPYIWYQSSHGCYYAIVKDMSGSFTGMGRSLALFTSVDGFVWIPSENVLVSDLTIQLSNGKSEKLSNLERPQIWHESRQPKVLFLAAALGLDHSFNLHVPLDS